MTASVRAEVVVIGSGAGGAMTALELALAGRDVCVIEEGARLSDDPPPRGSPDELRRAYRARGMSPLLGRTPVAFVEGMCVGGSTEINQGFWHRAPAETWSDWSREFALRDASAPAMAPHFDVAEDRLGVAVHAGPLPQSSELLSRGAISLGWRAEQVRRVAAGAARRLLPAAEASGARIIERCAARRLLVEDSRVTGVIAEQRTASGQRSELRLHADTVFVCAGAIHTPLLLRRSGIRRRVGDTLRVHPMLKVAALFPTPMEATRPVMPLIQIKEFAPELTLGGAFCTPGHLAMLLSDNWRENQPYMAASDHMMMLHATVRGTGRGSVRAVPLATAPLARYDVSDDDVRQLSRGLALLCDLSFAAGARRVFPGVQGLPEVSSATAAHRWREQPLPRSALSVTAVHAFASCPAGERRDRCAVDSFGRVHGLSNLYLNDASILPNSPGVNPQGTVYAMARRNALHFLAERRP